MGADTWYPPTTYEPAAGSGQFLSNPPFALAPTNRMIIRIRPLLELRQQHSDQALLDYLTLVTLPPTPGVVPTQELRDQWRCSQPQVSRRLSAVAAAGLVDLSSGWGAYQVHGLEVVA